MTRGRHAFNTTWPKHLTIPSLAPFRLNLTLYFCFFRTGRDPLSVCRTHHSFPSSLCSHSEARNSWRIGTKVRKAAVLAVACVVRYSLFSCLFHSCESLWNCWFEVMKLQSSYTDTEQAEQGTKKTKEVRKQSNQKFPQRRSQCLQILRSTSVCSYWLNLLKHPITRGVH